MPTDAQIQLFDIACKAATSIDKAITSKLTAMKVWLVEQYGPTAGPTYEQFWADRDALEVLAKEKGLADDQWVRKPYNMAVRDVYGAIPVSLTKAAVAKRAIRPEAPPRQKAANDSKVAKVSLPKDATTAVRQLLEHYGFGQILIAFSTVLAEHRETVKEAPRVRTIADRMMVKPQAEERRAVH